MTRKFFSGVFAFAAFTLWLTASAWAMDLVTAKSQGLVGEQPNGLIGAVSSSPPGEIADLVASINAERMAKYEAIASKNGTPVEQTQALAGQKLIGQTPAGQYVMGPDGKWMKK